VWDARIKPVVSSEQKLVGLNNRGWVKGKGRGGKVEGEAAAALQCIRASYTERFWYVKYAEIYIYQYIMSNICIFDSVALVRG
jgi:hypothetical protein